eukprot:2677912-Rhodomonas_salina.1
MSLSRAVKLCEWYGSSLPLSLPSLPLLCPPLPSSSSGLPLLSLAVCALRGEGEEGCRRERLRERGRERQAEEEEEEEEGR